MTTNTQDSYTHFLQGKVKSAPMVGFDCERSALPSNLFDWQATAVLQALKLGRSALFEDCGLGKTPQELAWSQAVAQHADAPTLILTPLAVAQQTRRESEKFGIEVTVCRDASEVRPGVNVTNYERLDRFDHSIWGGVALDESSILKAFSGATKRAIVEAFVHTPYKLAGTATPAPNDHMELGNHAEFLGVMPSNEMLARWFINDTTSFGTYRLKRYAEADFWQWVASWACCLAQPSDLTGDLADDLAYVLPPLREQTHLVEVDATQGAGERLFRTADVSATGMHREKRLTLVARIQRAVELANSSSEPFIVWCETNDESAALAAAIPDAVEVRGADSPDLKERRLAMFGDGTARVIVTKPSIAGWGLNWQHCRNVVFSSVTFSFESYYQAVRRSYRFGQTQPVNVHLIAAQTEAGILDVLRRKRQEHEKMQTKMTAAMKAARTDPMNSRALRMDAGATRVEVPVWLGA